MWDAMQMHACNDLMKMQLPEYGNVMKMQPHKCWYGGRCGLPVGYSTLGHYPAASEGVVEMTICFNSDYSTNPTQCAYHAVVGVVWCSSYLLWWLPFSLGNGAYCTTAM